MRWASASRGSVSGSVDSCFTARRYASAVYAVVVCPSVCLSVTRRHCTKTAKHRITQTTSYDSPWTIFWRKRLRFQRNSNGSSPAGVSNRREGGSNRRFSTNISLYPRNGARQGHSYFGTLIKTRMRSIELRYFSWSWVTPNYPKPSHFWYFISSFISS